MKNLTLKIHLFQLLFGIALLNSCEKEDSSNSRLTDNEINKYEYLIDSIYTEIDSAYKLNPSKSFKGNFSKY